MDIQAYENGTTRGISVSKTVQLNQASQVCCMVAATCGPSPATYLETTLQYPDGTVQTVSRTMVNPTVANTLRNGASLHLPAGTYRWTAVLASSVGAPVIPSDIQSLDPKILPADPNLAGNIGNVTVAGGSDGFFLVRSARDCRISARLQVSGPLAVGERIGTALVIDDLGTHARIESYPAEIGGPNNPSLVIDAEPLYLQAGRLYKFSHPLSPQPPSTGSCSLSASG